MSEAKRRFKNATHETRLNVQLLPRELTMLATSLVYFNRQRIGEMPYAYTTHEGRFSARTAKLIDAGYYVPVQDRSGRQLGVELTEDVGLQWATWAVSWGHCPLGLAVKPTDTVDPFTGKQLLPELFGETASLPEDTGYSYAAKAAEPAAEPVVEPVVKEERLPTFEERGLSAVELDELIGKEKSQRHTIAKMKLAQIESSHEIKRLREVNEQMGKVRLDAAAVAEKLEQAVKTVDDLQFRLNTALQQRKSDTDVLLKAEMQIDQLISRLKAERAKSATVSEPPKVQSDSPDAINAAVAEFVSFSDQIAANTIAAKHGVTVQAMRDAAKEWLVPA